MASVSQVPRSARGEPTWEIAELFPLQGDWTEEEYLSLDTNRLIELSEGRLEFLPMPSTTHQLIVRSLFLVLYRFVDDRDLGEVLFAPLPMRLWPGKIREPDVLFIRKENFDRISKILGIADLAIEVVSESNKNHDWVTKRTEYEAAGIPEYWIVDPQLRTITVFALESGKYIVHGEFVAGETATSKLLEGFGLDVDSILEVVDRTPELERPE